MSISYILIAIVFNLVCISFAILSENFRKHLLNSFYESPCLEKVFMQYIVCTLSTIVCLMWIMGNVFFLWLIK